MKELRMLTMNFDFISYHRSVTTGCRLKSDFQFQRSDIKRTLIDRIFSYKPHKQRFVKTLRPEWSGKHLPGDIFKCVFLNKSFVFLSKCHQNLLPRRHMTMRRHWYNGVVVKAISHCPNQWRPNAVTHVCVIRSQWVKLKEIWFHSLRLLGILWLTFTNR